jgi:hypothetical protein
MNGMALTRVGDAELESLLRHVHRGNVRCPLRRSDVLLLGLNTLAERGDVLFGLDEAGVRAVITAVLAERRARRDR